MNPLAILAWPRDIIPKRQWKIAFGSISIRNFQSVVDGDERFPGCSLVLKEGVPPGWVEPAITENHTMELLGHIEVPSLWALNVQPPIPKPGWACPST